MGKITYTLEIEFEDEVYRKKIEDKLIGFLKDNSIGAHFESEDEWRTLYDTIYWRKIKD